MQAVNSENYKQNHTDSIYGFANQQNSDMRQK